MLVQEAAAGSGVSYGALYDRYATQVFNYCLRLTSSPEDAADATQEAFVNVLRRLQDDDRPVLEFSAYLFAAARNESYALMRQRVRTHPSDSPPAERGRVADLETDPERVVLLRDSQEAVREANAQLAPRHREVLALREVAGRSYEEIGETLGISENAAAQLIWRARAKLRGALTAGAVASVVATSEECERAQLLLSMVQDGERVEEADRVWLDEHLDECGSCRTANRMLLEVGASYRCWLPVALFAGMRTDTLTRAGDLVGADWSHVPAPGKGSAGSSAGAAGAAGAVAAVTAAVIAAAAIGSVALLRSNDVVQVDPAAKQRVAGVTAASPQSAPARASKAKAARAGGKFVAARATGSGVVPALATSPTQAPDPLIESAAPETLNAPLQSDPPQDGSGGPGNSPEQVLEVSPGSDPPAPPDPTADPPTLPDLTADPPTPPDLTADPPTPPDTDPVKPDPVTDPPVDTPPPPPPPPPPDCSGSSRVPDPAVCPPGQGEEKPGDGEVPPPGDGEVRPPGDGVQKPGDGGTPPGRLP